MMVEFSTTKSIKETRAQRLFAQSATSHSAADQYLQVTLARFRSRQAGQVIQHFSLMRRRSRLTTHSSNTTIAITRGFRACFVIVVKPIHRNRRYRAKPPMHLAQAVTHSSSQIRQVTSALFVTRMSKAERLRPFHHCAVSASDSIMRSTLHPLV